MSRKFVTEIQAPKLKDSSLLRQSAFINNEWVKAKSGQTFSVIDPATDNEIGKVPEMNVEDTKEAIMVARVAFKEWANLTAKNRHDYLLKLHSQILENQNDLATILTLENGKTYVEALGEVKYGASFVEWFAQEARRVYGDIIPPGLKNHKFVVEKQPIGVVGIITPWNFPNAMITRKVSAALAAGCTVVIKPGAETPYSALALAELALRAGFPKGVINVVTTDKYVKEIGLEICTNPVVKKISFTGSTAVGKLLMEQCSSTLKKVSLELGGNAPFIVFDDADIDTAVEDAITCKFRASGQTCISPNRIYVQSSIYAEFASRLADKVGGFKIGNGFDTKTTHGPLINQNAVKKVTKHVEDAVAKGAEILVGGTKHTGNFFYPTVLTGMNKGMVITSEETFGPVAALYKFETEAEVLNLANDCNSGLAGYFYSKDIGRCWRVADALEVGMVGVNTAIIGSCEIPFGGIKESGIGREGSKYGIDEFISIKYINFGGLQKNSNGFKL
ncbi:15100_t:CDS:2 [Funneliformis geosporum]|uniref:Succinate-semialdehyde dehydrogenase n=1 Tax=Funneliformis geosporum TaxID=1117311 RepID=A0A9W4SQG1_9GLOM|nr:15100_t:CDS:2 [Funneliformis geosporum]CAI2177874.1 4743_t:CDS:2 [Funneliformis geosporum]